MVALEMQALIAILWPLSVHATTVHLSFSDGLLNNAIDGRIVLLLAPQESDPLEDIDVTTSPDLFFGKNVYNISSSDAIDLSGGSGLGTDSGIYGFPNVNLDAVAAGSYNAQAFLTPYEKVLRADGSVVSVHFPCGDGAPNINGAGSLATSVEDINIGRNISSVELTFDNTTRVDPLTGAEIRSEKLSMFWNRDMYVGANVLLPHGYDGNNASARYPVIYSQGHWPAGRGAFRYPFANFSFEWDRGVINGTEEATERETPKMILVTFRHEAPFYDDSYAVNTANLGPYGDAINEELIPYIDENFNTIAEPYARIQEGGSTGGWVSAASLIFRPDVFGACFSSYPDSLDFHSHQDIKLYNATNAYIRADGSKIGSIREFVNDTEHILTTVEQENHWELTFGTSSRSFLQWDVWNAVFGAQGLNNYPLEPWDKVTGEIYPSAVEFWRQNFDLANHIVTNWDNERNLGEVLQGRIFIYVGTHDDYYLNEGVQEFQKTVEAKGGPDWANVTILSGKTHGGNHQDREIWDYLELVHQWVQDHAPEGKTPLSDSVTDSTSKGNQFEEVIARGGRQAALSRQANPSLHLQGSKVVADVGRWDPGVTLEAQWKVGGEPCGKSFGVRQGDEICYEPRSHSVGRLQLQVTGRKRGYTTESRNSDILTCLI